LLLLSLIWQRKK